VEARVLPLIEALPWLAGLPVDESLPTSLAAWSAAVKAGLNGVMMGTFLTTLGAEPEEDRGMFEELGLNTKRQSDNGANPRPDNRSGWLEGEAPSTPIDELIDSQAEANFWDPSTQLRVIKTKKKPPPYPSEAAEQPAGWGD